MARPTPPRARSSASPSAPGRRIAVHKEWMVRAYVVTFAFVTFRLFSDYGPTAHLAPEGGKAVTLAWACWAVPLLITETVLQLRRMHGSAPSV